MPPTPSFTDFDYHINGLIATARAQGVAASVPGVAPRPWNIPPKAPLDGTDIENPAYFIYGCDRSELNAVAILAYETGNQANAGRIGQVMAAKMAIDYQAAYERAKHARHANAVRRRVWAMARRTGHGTPAYGVFQAVREKVGTTLAASTATINSPPGT